MMIFCSLKKILMERLFVLVQRRVIPTYYKTLYEGTLKSLLLVVSMEKSSKSGERFQNKGCSLMTESPSP